MERLARGEVYTSRIEDPGKRCKIPSGVWGAPAETDFVKFELENASDDKYFGNLQRDLYSQNGISVVD